LPALLLMTTQTNVEAATAGPLFYYYLPDHLGSSNVILDRQGNVVQQYQYGTFGQTTFTGSGTAYPVSNRYTDQIMDDDTGLYYYGGRYFDPQLGRFIQPDPTVPNPCDPQSLNRYSYVRNNPLNLSDPSGYDDVPSDSPDPFPSGGGDLFGGGDSPPAQAEMPPTQAANGSSFLSANWGWSTSGLTTTYSGSITLGSPGIGFVTWAGSITTSLTAGIEDDGMMLQGRPVVDSVSFGVSYQPPTSLAVESGQTGGGWLSGVTNAAGWLSMIPGPVGAAASGINAVGEAMQGHWGQAALAVGGIALAAVGAGVVTQFGRAARVVKVEQYALRAADNGFYPVMIRGAEDPQFLTYLEKGDAWKFGTTKNPATRYSQAYLHSVGEHGVEYSTEFSGTSREALTVQKMKIQNVRSQSGRLPPGNKIVN
jgi:RHS repeat-associated protein